MNQWNKETVKSLEDTTKAGYEMGKMFGPQDTVTKALLPQSKLGSLWMDLRFFVWRQWRSMKFALMMAKARISLWWRTR